MGTWELILIAIGLSMDAFAVSIVLGLSMYKMKYRYAVIAGCFFGGFQALMPLFGYALGAQFKEYVVAVDHWIAFILLSLIGAKMIKEAFEREKSITNAFNLKSMLILSLATSIDALAVGVTFAFLQVNILNAVLTIGLATFLFSFTGVKVGNLFGNRFRSKAELAGGLILIAIGLRILIEHLA